MLPDTVNKDIQQLLKEQLKDYKYVRNESQSGMVTKQTSTSSVSASDSLLNQTNESAKNSENSSEVDRNEVKSPISNGSSNDLSQSEKVQELAAKVEDLLIGYNLERYKYAVQINLFQAKEHGTRMECRMFWDSEKDKCIQETYKADNFTCVVVAFAVYYD